MKRARAAMISVALITAGLGSASGMVSTASGATQAPSTSGLHISKSFLQATGQRVVSSQAAVARRAELTSAEIQILAGEFFTALQKENSATFVSYGRTAPGANEYFASFTTEPSDSVLESIASLPFKTIVNWGFPASGEQLQVAADQLTRSLDEDPRVSELRVGGVATPAAHGIEVRILPTDSTTATPEEIIADGLAATNAARSASPSLSIPVVTTEGPVSFEDQADVKGGHATNCYTTGFTASWNGNLGFMTAGHGTGCASLNLYDQIAGVISSFNMPRRPTIDAGYIDVWFAATQPGHTTTYRFRDSANSETVVTGVQAPSIYMDVCKYGLVTGRHCGASTPLYVRISQSFCATAQSDGLTYCRLWEVNRDVTDPGDSGGPWFLGQAPVRQAEVRHHF